MNRIIGDLTIRALVLVPLTVILLSSCGGGSAGNNTVLSTTAAQSAQSGIEGSGGVVPPGPVVSCAPSSIAVDPTGRFAYVANEGCGNTPPGSVSMYTIDAMSGALASIGPPVPTNDEGALSVAVSPFGRFVYVANWGEGDTSGSVSAFIVNGTTGALTFTANVSRCDTLHPGSCGPSSVAVDPSGKFAYAANQNGFPPTSVSIYSIDPTTGALTSTGLVAVQAGFALAVAVDPLGRFAYVGSSTELPNSVGVVETYAIDPTTGALRLVGSIAGGPGIALHPSGNFVYVMSQPSGFLTCAVNHTTGVLTSVGTNAGSLMAIDPSGQFAYVSNATNELSTYAINLTTGALTPQGTALTGPIPGPIAIHPSGKFAYVVNRGSNEVWAYRIDSVTGAWTFIASIPN